MTNAELDTLWSRAEQFSGGFTRYRFAALVAAAERNRMIADGWRQCAQGQKTTQHCGMAEQVRAEEREACARVCETEGARVDASWASCAAAIRARGQQRPEPTYPSDPIWREQKRLEMEAWARNKLARHGIQIPEDDDDGNPSF
jgi:hypothetical protein